MDWTLEVLAAPVADVDRAKSFYTERCGFILDHDIPVSDTMRIALPPTFLTLALCGPLRHCPACGSTSAPTTPASS